VNGKQLGSSEKIFFHFWSDGSCNTGARHVKFGKEIIPYLYIMYVILLPV